MSLVLGGLFDVIETKLWQPPNSSHRVGTDVDIENVSLQDTTVTVINPETGQPRERAVRVFNVDWINRYTRFMTGKNWRFIEEGQQDPFRNPDEENPGIRYAHFRWRGN